MTSLLKRNKKLIQLIYDQPLIGLFTNDVMSFKKMKFEVMGSRAKILSKPFKNLNVIQNVKTFNNSLKL